MRIVGWIVAGLVLLVVAAAGIGYALFDPESLKPRITEAVKQATGRDLQLKGRIGLALSLRPTIAVKDVSLSNPPGFSRPEMASIGELDLRLALVPLFSRRVEIDRLIVVKPDVRLETNAKGEGNWVFAPAAKPPGASAPAPAAAPSAEPGKSQPMAIAIKDVRLDDGMFAYRDGKTGETRTVAVKQIATQAASADAPLHVTAAFTVDGTDVGIVADTGPLRAMTGAGGAPWPVKLAVTAAGAKVSIDGTIADPVKAAGLNLAVAADVPDLAALGAAMKQDLPDIKTLALRAKLTGDPAKVALHDVTLTSSAGDLAGDLTFTAGPPMDLTGTLKSDKFDADRLVRPAAAAKPAAGTGAPTSAPAPAGKPKWMIPDQPLPFGALRGMNADLRVTMGALHAGGSDYKAIEAHARLKDGALTVDPASADLPQGHVALTLAADAGKPEPPVHVTLRAPGIALGPLLASLGEPAYATGNLEVLADLHGTGNTPHAIASSLDGTLGLAVAGGSLDVRRAGGTAARVLETVNPKAAAGADALRCFALRLDFAHGVGTVRALALGSTLVNMDGSGSINLANETLGLLLRSRALVAGAAVTVPVRVSGALAAPQTKVDEVGIAQSNAAALGSLLGGSVASAIGSGQATAAGDSCPAALAAARGQAAPAATEAPPAAAPTPAPAQPSKPSNPGQLLKQLFR